MERRPGAIEPAQVPEVIFALTQGMVNGAGDTPMKYCAEALKFLLHEAPVNAAELPRKFEQMKGDKKWLTAVAYYSFQQNGGMELYPYLDHLQEYLKMRFQESEGSPVVWENIEKAVTALKEKDPSATSLYRRAVAQVFSDPANNTLQLKRIQFWEGGNAVDGFDAFLKAMLPGLSGKGPSRPEGLPSRTPALPGNVPDGIFVFPEGGRLDLKGPAGTWYGRTWIKIQGKKVYHVKFLKKGENSSDLAYEHDMMNYLNDRKAAWGLRGVYPRGKIKLAQVPADVLPDLAKSREDAGQKILLDQDRGHYTMMVYEVDLDDNGQDPYTVYLNDADVSPDEFEDAFEMNIHDRIVLARHGLFDTEIIELFHSQENAQTRLYDWMVMVFTHQRERAGAGRLDDFVGATIYPNIRKSGLADFSQLRFIDDLIDDPSVRRQADNRLGRLMNMVGWDKDSADRAYPYITAALLGDMLLSLALMPPTYLLRQAGQGTDGLDQEYLQKMLLKLFTTAFETYTGEAPVAFRDGLDLHIKNMAAQMSYFMSAKAEKDFQQGRAIPQELYPGAVISKMEDGRGFKNGRWDIREAAYTVPSRNPDKVIRMNSQDLGPVNGPNPLQELIRALYIVTTLMVVHSRLPLRGAPAAERTSARSEMRLPVDASVAGTASETFRPEEWRGTGAEGPSGTDFTGQRARSEMRAPDADMLPLDFDNGKIRISLIDRGDPEAENRKKTAEEVAKVIKGLMRISGLEETGQEIEFTIKMGSVAGVGKVENAIRMIAPSSFVEKQRRFSNGSIRTAYFSKAYDSIRDYDLDAEALAMFLAQELAHVLKGHKPTRDPREYNRQENEADEQAVIWMKQLGLEEEAIRECAARMLNEPHSLQRLMKLKGITLSTVQPVSGVLSIKGLFKSDALDLLEEVDSRTPKNFVEVALKSGVDFRESKIDERGAYYFDGRLSDSFRDMAAFSKTMGLPENASHYFSVEDRDGKGIAHFYPNGDSSQTGAVSPSPASAKTEASARSEMRGEEEELTESLLSKGVRHFHENGGHAVVDQITLANVWKGGPPVTLEIRTRQADMFMVDVIVDGKKIGEVELEWKENRLESDWLFPLGRDHSDSYAAHQGRGISNTIFNWIAWEADRNNVTFRNAPTFTMGLVHLLHRYFGGEQTRVLRKGADAKDGELFSDLVRKYGFFGKEIWDACFLSAKEDGREVITYTSLSLERLGDSGHRYRIAKIKKGSGSEIFKQGDVIEISSGGVIVGTPYTLHISERPISLEGPGTFTQVPRQRIARSEVREVEAFQPVAPAGNVDIEKSMPIPVAEFVVPKIFTRLTSGAL